MKDTARVFNIQHYSLHDGPGIRTTVFFKGCPLRCRWCCNPESQNCEAEVMQGKTVGSLMTVDEIIEEVEKDEVFYRHGDGGMTISGGEPLMQQGFLIELLKEAKKHYLKTAIETSGFGDSDILIEAAKYIDTVFYDIKTLNEEKHKEWVGVSNRQIIANFIALKEAYPHKKVVVRTPVIPGFNDTKEDIEKILGFLKNYGNVEYELLPYHYYGRDKYKYLDREYGMKNAVLDKEKFEQLKCLLKDER